VDSVHCVDSVHSGSDPKSLVRSWVRSAGVGAISTLVDFAALATLVSGLGLSARLASPLALGLGLACQFVGNKLFAFGDRRPAWAKQVALFLGIEAFAFGANLFLFDVAVRKLALPYLVVRGACQAVVYFGISLPLWTRLFEPGVERVEVAS
jgi:putative flippase GtrA